MFEVNCYDVDGNSINYLTQWDSNCRLYIPMDGYNLSETPEIHFCNKKSSEALPVTCDILDNTLITEVPNELLQESFPIIGHIYLSNTFSDGVTEQKTCITFIIPVKERVKPADYIYVSNYIGYTFDEIINLVYSRVINSYTIKDLENRVSALEEKI